MLSRFQKSKMDDGLRPLSWIFFYLNIAGNSPCGSEVKAKLTTKFRKDRSNGLKVIAIKNPRWLPTYGRHLGLKKLKVSGDNPCGSEVVQQISNKSVERLKVIAISTRTEKAKGLWPNADSFNR
jgi:hypothetical protein